MVSAAVAADHLYRTVAIDHARRRGAQRLLLELRRGGPYRREGKGLDALAICRGGAGPAAAECWEGYLLGQVGSAPVRPSVSMSSWPLNASATEST